MERSDGGKSSGGWRTLLETRGVNRFEGRGQPVQIPSHLHKAPPEAHMERITYYQTHFPGHAINERETQKPIVRPDMLGVSSSKLDGRSAYALDFPKYPYATPVGQCTRPNNLHRQPGQVEAQSSYTLHFTEPPDARLGIKSEPIIRPDNLHPTKDKFGQQSVTAADF